MVIEHILEGKIAEPMSGYSDAELLQQHLEQREIMTFHEDYQALRGSSSPVDRLDGPLKGGLKALKAGKVEGKGQQKLARGKPTSLTKTVKMCKPVD